MEYTQPIGDDPGDPYIDANPVAGIEGSAVPAAAIEHPQREIVNAIAAAGLEPDSDDLTQLTAAIEAMIDARPTAETGDVKTTLRITPPSGWLMLNGDSIGSAASGADQASDDYETLFTLLWESMADAQAPVSGGRGASAAADWAADKTLTMPDARGRTVIGSGTGSSLTARTHGDTGGEETHVLTVGEMPAHAHTQRTANTGGGSNGLRYFGDAGTPNSRTDINSTLSAGSNNAHNNMQPWLALNWIVRC